MRRQIGFAALPAQRQAGEPREPVARALGRWIVETPPRCRSTPEDSGDTPLPWYPVRLERCAIRAIAISGGEVEVHDEAGVGPRGGETDFAERGVVADLEHEVAGQFGLDRQRLDDHQDQHPRLGDEDETAVAIAGSRELRVEMQLYPLPLEFNVGELGVPFSSHLLVHVAEGNAGLERRAHGTHELHQQRVQFPFEILDRHGPLLVRVRLHHPLKERIALGDRPAYVKLGFHHSIHRGFVRAGTQSSPGSAALSA